MIQKILKWFRLETRKATIGKVSYLNHKKGFGFIKSPNVDDRIFVHFKDSKVKLKKGAKVSFQLDKTDKGYRAKEVLIAD